MSTGKIGGVWMQDAIAGLEALGSSDEGIAVGDMGIVTGATDPGLYRCTAVLAGSSTWDGPLGGSAGGGGTGMDPGYFDSTGSVFCNHFDTEGSGIWTSTVGNDLLHVYGTAPVLVDGPTRPFGFFAGGGLAATVQANLQITGDVTALLAFKMFATSTATQTLFGVADTGEGASENIMFEAYMQTGRFATQHEYGSGSNDAFIWNSSESPDARYQTSWSVMTIRRDETGALGTAKRRSVWIDHVKSAETAYTNSATGGGDTYLNVGSLVGLQLTQGCAIGGLVIFDSALADSAIHAQIDRIKRGTAK